MKHAMRGYVSPQLKGDKGTKGSAPHDRGSRSSIRSPFYDKPTPPSQGKNR